MLGLAFSVHSQDIGYEQHSKMTCFVSSGMQSLNLLSVQHEGVNNNVWSYCWFAGLLDQSRVREFLCGPLFEVEIHDRDRVVRKFGEGCSLFGEERDDDLLSVPNTGLHSFCFDVSSLQFIVLIHLGISVVYCSDAGGRIRRRASGWQKFNSVQIIHF